MTKKPQNQSAPRQTPQQRQPMTDEVYSPTTRRAIPSTEVQRMLDDQARQLKPPTMWDRRAEIYTRISRYRELILETKIQLTAQEDRIVELTKELKEIDDAIQTELRSKR